MNITGRHLLSDAPWQWVQDIARCVPSSREMPLGSQKTSKEQYKIRNPVVPVASYEIEASLVIFTKQRGEKQKLVESCWKPGVLDWYARIYALYLSGGWFSCVLVQGRGFRHDDHAWSPPQETRRRSIMDFSRLEIGSSYFMSCDVIWCAAVWWCVLCCVIVWVIMWWCGCWWCCSCCLHLGRHWEPTIVAGFLSNISLLGLKHARWSLFHSCQCSVPSAEYSDSLEDDAMHCM